MIHAEERHKKIIRDILSHFSYQFYVFGSRAKGSQKRLSDLDLCVMETLSLKDRVALEEAFDNSDLPFTVDILEWDTISDSFKKLIQDDLVPVEA